MDIELRHAGVPVTILDGPYVEDGVATPRAIEDYEQVVASLDQLRGFAAAEMLPLYNETWLDEAIGTLDETGFAQRLTDPSVTLYDEIGAAIVYFADSDLFGGHYVEVSLRNGQPTSAALAG